MIPLPEIGACPSSFLEAIQYAEEMLGQGASFLKAGCG